MESVILVPAEGRQERWQSTNPKQLITVNGESLLHRLQRQFLDYTEAFIILTADPSIQSLFPQDTYLPRDCRYLCETLVNTRHLWGRRTIIVLGDVVLSSDTARRIATDRRPCAFWGNWTDILAISVYEEEANSLMLAMWSSVREMKRGKLWEAYRAYCGFEMDDHVIDDHGVFIDTMDWSRDFDEVQQYQSFMYELKKGYIDPW